MSDAQFKTCLEDGADEGVPENLSPKFLEQVFDTSELEAEDPHQNKDQEYDNDNPHSNQVENGAVDHVRAIVSGIDRSVAQHGLVIETFALVSIANLFLQELLYFIRRYYLKGGNLQHHHVPNF